MPDRKLQQQFSMPFIPPVNYQMVHPMHQSMLAFHTPQEMKVL